MKMIYVGNEMSKVIEAVVENARAHTERATEALIEEIAIRDFASNMIIEMQEQEIEMLKAQLRNAEASVENVKRAMEMLLDACEEQEVEINETLASLELYEAAFNKMCDLFNFDKSKVLADTVATLEQEKQPACCAAGHCGTDKCGGSCKDEPKLGASFTLGQYEQEEAKVKGRSIFVVTKPSNSSF